MKKNLLFIVLFLCSWGFLNAQNNDNVPLPKSLQGKQPANKERKVNLTVGGYFGFQVGTYTCIEVSPHIGVKPWDFLCVGVGGTYMFSYMKTGYSTGTSAHVFGANAFVEGYIWKQRIIAHAEYEFLSYPNTADSRLNCHAVLIGPGYNQMISDKVYAYALILFPVVTTVDIYSIPVVRIGVNVKL